MVKKRDYLLISVYVLTAFLGIGFTWMNKRGGDAYIYVSGQLYGRYDLSVPESIRLVSNDGIVNELIYRIEKYSLS